ncbi:hypothetical protein H2201_005652 [Coniosporium apollinis]|uniref:ribonuclease H n=2 Tax=Coniosporium TaxID=2810619 RepID=A0ABQ9NQ36_9PEZI|nr:hypothetical protein H2199_003310 [Cladosporium sp. JES 115]KAJ9663444.1 hypothetical protein H2201_005652 [Coniosporium apollinis]
MEEGTIQGSDCIHPPPLSPAQQGSRKSLPFERYGEDANLLLLEHLCPEWTKISCPDMEPCEDCGRRPAHANEISIAIDGTCRNNGNPHARAAMAVFVAFYSEYNVGKVMSHPTPTSQQAELYAGIIALEQGIAIKKNGMQDLMTLVIKTDSDYLYKGMTEYIFKWKDNGYRNSRGKSVTNATLFKRMEELTVQLEGLGVSVLFWPVPRAFNFIPDILANAALDRTTVDDAYDEISEKNYSLGPRRCGKIKEKYDVN